MRYRFADRVAQMDASDVKKLMEVIADPSIISFGAGSPAKSLFPIEELKSASDVVYGDSSLEAFQYSNTEGFGPLREWIAERHNLTNQTNFQKNNVIITNGSQQGIDLMAKLFLNKGDIVLCERPTYTSALSAFRSYECEFLDVSIDSEGMIIKHVEDLISKHNNIKIIYIVPTYQNPTGVTWSVERRNAIATIASKYGLILIEDDPYKEIGFKNVDIPSISKFDTDGRVVSLGSFSKTLCPGLRVGWMIANEKIIEQLIYTKQVTDVQTSAILQRQIYNYLEMYDFDTHLSTLRQKYKERSKIACDSIKKYFPENISFSEPEGGFFLWLTFPDHIDTKKILPEALQRGVAFVPGHSFYTDKSIYNNIRINYSSVTEQDLVKGLEILGSIFKEVCI